MSKSGCMSLKLDLFPKEVKRNDVSLHPRRLRDPQSGCGVPWRANKAHSQAELSGGVHTLSMQQKESPFHCYDPGGAHLPTLSHAFYPKRKLEAKDFLLAAKRIEEAQRKLQALMRSKEHEVTPRAPSRSHTPLNSNLKSSPAPRGRGKISKLPLYNGSTCREFVSLMYDLECYFDRGSFSDKMKCTIAVMCLNGYALSWYACVDNERKIQGKTSIKSWSFLKGLLREHFMPSYVKDTLSLKWKILKQSALSVDAYIEEFKKLFVACDVKMTPGQKVHKFYHGLKLEILEMIYLGQNCSFDEMCVLALHHEKLYKEKKACLESLHVHKGSENGSLHEMSSSFKEELMSDVNESNVVAPMSNLIRGICSKKNDLLVTSKTSNVAEHIRGGTCTTFSLEKSPGKGEGIYNEAAGMPRLNKGFSYMRNELLNTPRVLIVSTNLGDENSSPCSLEKESKLMCFDHEDGLNFKGVLPWKSYWLFEPFKSNYTLENLDVSVCDEQVVHWCNNFLFEPLRTEVELGSSCELKGKKRCTIPCPMGFNEFQVGACVYRSSRGCIDEFFWRF